MYWAPEIIFAVDLLLSFNTAFVDQKGNVVEDRCQIVKHYLKTWLILDLICVYPFSLTELNYLENLKMLKIVKLQKRFYRKNLLFH